jgi:hypothetical protein
MYRVMCTLQQVGRRAGGVEGAGVSHTEAASSADLGSSSEYSSETLEDRSGKWFLVNSTWTRVSRP